MKKENSNRPRIVAVRFTQVEFAVIENRFKASTCRKLSNYIQDHLFSRPIITTYRNQSLDDLMEETIALTAELKSIGRNINQIAKQANSNAFPIEMKEHLFWFEIERKKLENKMDQISSHTQKIAEQWLRS